MKFVQLLKFSLLFKFQSKGVELQRIAILRRVFTMFKRDLRFYQIYHNFIGTEFFFFYSSIFFIIITFSFSILI